MALPYIGKIKTQPASAAHSTDSKVRTFYLATKMVQWLWTILQNLGFQVSDAPTPIYEDSQPTIDIIKEKHPTSRVKRIAVTIQYVHAQNVLLNIDNVKLKNTLQPLVVDTKRSTGPLLKRHYFYICGNFYNPYPNSDN